MNVMWPAQGALVKHLRGIAEAARTTGRGANRVKGDIRHIAIEDNEDKLLGRGLLEGVDKYGKPLARMKDSTYQNKKRGLGPVLVPRGMQSRFITNLKAEWVNVEDFAMLTLRYVNIVNKKGQSFAQYHLTGTRRGLPKRDVGGVTPRGMSKIRARISQWAQDIKKGKR